MSKIYESAQEYLCVVCHAYNMEPLEICDENSSLCIKHCTEPGHSHCDIFHCGDSANKCGFFLDLLTSLSLTKYSRCINHCDKADHGHCNTFCCDFSAIYCVHSGKCIKHCTGLGHSHCISESCGLEVSVCGKTSLCAKHCTSTKCRTSLHKIQIIRTRVYEIPKHPHCTNDSCDNATNICETTSLCAKHCTKTEKHSKFGYTHCTKFDCDSEANLCRNSLLCISHCKSSHHGHCTENNCSKIVTGDSLLFCVEHKKI